MSYTYIKISNLFLQSCAENFNLIIINLVYFYLIIKK